MNHYLRDRDSIQAEAENLSPSAFLRKMTFKDVIFVIALATKPLYLTSSGSVQISDLLFGILFLLVTFSGKPMFNHSQRTNKWITWFFICLIYQFLINTFWYFKLQSTLNADNTLLKSILYYVFNFIVCVSIIQLVSIEGFSYTLRLYLLGTALSVLIALVGVVLVPSGNGRAVGTFNNPNQLGYFSIVVLTAITYFAKEIKASLRFILVVLCMVLSILSLSKASILASTILLFAYFINSRDRMGAAKLFSVLFAITAIGIVVYILMYADWEFLNEQDIIVTLRRRLGALTTENDSSLGASRGYDRVIEVGAGILSGVGEGANTRFATMNGKEAHSLYASTLVSYGIVGFSIMTWLVSVAITTNRRVVRSVLCFSGILAYCVTHNGIRNTLLWAMLAMLLVSPAPVEPAQHQIVNEPPARLG